MSAWSLSQVMLMQLARDHTLSNQDLDLKSHGRNGKKEVYTANEGLIEVSI